MKFIPPSVLSKGYTCPHCGAFAEQGWWGCNWSGDRYDDHEYHSIFVGRCKHCDEQTLWIEDRMIYPSNAGAPPPISEMPKNVEELYREAAEIATASPRGAAALLRLAIQLLCKELGETGDNINSDISALVRQGLPAIVQQSLDIVRVTGNNAVHPGQIDVDDPSVCGKLFELLNIIVEYMIAMPTEHSRKASYSLRLFVELSGSDGLG